MKEIHRSKMMLLFYDKQKRSKDVRINYVTQDGRRIQNLLVHVLGIEKKGTYIKVCLPNTENKEQRKLISALILDVDGVRIR